MLRTVAKKVAWVGRTASMVFGLALVLALVFGALSVAAAHTGSAGLFHLNHNNNVSTALTKLTGNLTGAVLTVDNNGTGPALSLEVGTNRPPMTVNSPGKVANLNADRLDNRDSTALPVTMKTNVVGTGECQIAEVLSNCAHVTVKVPTGKQYDVTVWSSFAAESDSDSSTQYCVHMESNGATGCQGADFIRLAADYPESAATSGEFLSLPAGTYTFSTGITSDSELVTGNLYNVHTTVMVRDAAAPGPSIN
jgi:hypothetical protein